MKSIHVKWSINDSCNLRCPFCIAEKPPEKQLDAEIQFKMLDKMHDMGVTSIDFFGKEPFLNDRIFVLMDYCRDKVYPFSFSAITNGINLDKYKDLLILSPLRRLTISHDGFANARQKVLTFKEIRDLVSEYFFVEVSLDILRSNYRDSKSIVIRLFEEARVSSVYVKPIIAVGALSDNIESDYALTEAEFGIVCKELRGIPNVTISIPFRFPKLTQKYKDNPVFYCDPVCTCGDYIFVDNLGTAFGCGEVAYTSRSRGCHFLSTPPEDILKTIQTSGRRVCCEKRKY